MKNSITALVALAIASMPRSTKAQAPIKKIPVIVSCACDDRVGSLFATAVRDQIAASPRYYLVDDTSANLDSSYAIEVVTLPIDRDESGSSTRSAISITYVLARMYIDSSVQICGKDRAEACAKDDISNLDGYITSIRANSKH